MNIAIIDDEKEMRSNISSLIKQWSLKQRFEIECCCFENGNAFVDSLDEYKFDIVFMDIYMGNSNGIDAAYELRKREIGCLIIFLTSSTEHMPEAFSCHAFDYIIKSTVNQKLFRVLNDAVSTLPNVQKYIDLSFDKQTISVLYSELCYATADSNYCTVNCGNQYRCRITFGELSDALCKDERFCVINRGILVNFDYVLTMNGTACEMKDGTAFPLNTKRKTLLRQQLIQYRFNVKKKALERSDTA